MAGTPKKRARREQAERDRQRDALGLPPIWPPEGSAKSGGNYAEPMQRSSAFEPLDLPAPAKAPAAKGVEALAVDPKKLEEAAALAMERALEFIRQKFDPHSTPDYMKLVTLQQQTVQSVLALYARVNAAAMRGKDGDKLDQILDAIRAHETG